MFLPLFVLSFRAEAQDAFTDPDLKSALRHYLRGERLAKVLDALKEGHPPTIKQRLYEANMSTLDQWTALVKAVHSYRGKMKPEEAAAVLKFYLALDFTENRLWKRNLILRDQVNRVFQLVKMIEWPPVPERIHGQNQPAPAFHRQEWVDAANPFSHRGLRRAFLFIQAARINYEAFHNSLYHVSELHEAFFKNLQSSALGQDNYPGDPNLALKALRVYLVSTKTDSAIHRLGRDPERWPETADESSKMAKFILELNAMSAIEGLRFFALGELPDRVRVPDSKIVSRLLAYLSSHKRKSVNFEKYSPENAADSAALAALIAACRG